MDLRRSRRLIVAAAGVALALRLAFGLFYWTDRPLTHDEREYLSLAAGLSDHGALVYVDRPQGTAPRFGRAPGYPAFLSLLRPGRDVDAAPTIVKVVQSILGALALFMIAAITRRAAGNLAAAIAAWTAAVYPPFVAMPSYVLSEALYLPIALGCVLLLARTAIGAGVLTGLAALIRPGILVFVALAAVWFARRRLIHAAALFSIAALLSIAPWTIRNYRVHGRLVPIASEGGVTFWTGNHPLARGEGDLAANPELKRAEVAFRDAHPGLTGDELEPLYYRDAFHHIRGNPVRWITLVGRKAFYTIVPIGPSYSLHSTRYLLASVVPYALLAPLAIAGFVVISRNGQPPEPLYLLAASVGLTSLVFFPQERFRIPVIDPLVIVGAAAAIGGATRQNP